MTAASTIRERLGWEVTPELYGKIRHLWIAHSKAEDGRDLDGLIASAMFNAIPIILLVIFFQKYFIRSAASSAVKG